MENPRALRGKEYTREKLQINGLVTMIHKLLVRTHMSVKRRYLPSHILRVDPLSE
jgi:hypothetical protein